MKAFKITGSNVENRSKRYPNEIPFIVKDCYNDLYLVTKDEDTNEYKFVNLQDGTIAPVEYDTLESMFDENPNDIILCSEINVYGEWKDEE